MNILLCRLRAALREIMQDYSCIVYVLSVGIFVGYCAKSIPMFACVVMHILLHGVEVQL